MFIIFQKIRGSKQRITESIAKQARKRRNKETYQRTKTEKKGRNPQ